MGGALTLGLVLLAITVCAVHDVIELPKKPRQHGAPMPPTLSLRDPGWPERVRTDQPYQMSACLQGETVQEGDDIWHVIGDTPSPAAGQVPVLGRGDLPDRTCSTMLVQYEGMKTQWHRFTIWGEVPWARPTRRTLEWR